MIIQDRPVLTVSELTRDIKQLLERSFHSLSITGEISNFVRHTSGHLYFTLKDGTAQLSCVMFRGNASSMFFQPSNGLEVVCTGDITVYEPRGNYQLLVSTMSPRGEGALQAAFEKLKRKLHAEGLFDEQRKRPIPMFPRRVALVTSRTGAAVRDMISVSQRRNPGVQLVLVPVQVQGAGAAEQIAAAIDLCNAYGDLDVIITGRGGGSLEDLWAFNEEVVARAIHRSSIPVVSAVGHEIDFTIADFVADVRAATPSVAAELVVPDRGELSGHLEEVARRMGKFVDFTLHQKRLDVSRLGRHWVFRKPEQAVQRSMQQLDDLQERITRSVALTEERAMNSLRMLSRDIDAHNPRRILSKGYVMVRRGDDIMESASAVRAGDHLNLVFRDGDIEAQVSHTDAQQ